MNSTEIIDKINNIKAEIKSLKESLVSHFKSELLQLLKDNPEVASISMSLNNHEFNDGDDLTSYSLYYEDLMLILQSGDEFDGYQSDYKVKYGPIRKKFIEFFELFDVDSFYEDNFGDEYNGLSFSVDCGFLKDA